MAVCRRDFYLSTQELVYPRDAHSPFSQCLPLFVCQFNCIKIKQSLSSPERACLSIPRILIPQFHVYVDINEQDYRQSHWRLPLKNIFMSKEHVRLHQVA